MLKEPAMAHEEIASLVRAAAEIVVFSGAGLSADSGIPTFRDGATGLWNNVDPDEVASIEGFMRNPRLVWNWLRQLKNLVDERQPNPGHRAIAQLERLAGGKRLTVVTQNIDGYHSRAGNGDVLEVHGTIHRLRCHERCGFAAEWGESLREPFPCPQCGAPARPDLVLFGEALDHGVFSAAGQRSARADVFFCVGTSFTVQPAAHLPVWAKASGAAVVEINPHRTSLSDVADYSIREGASQFFSALCRTLTPDAPDN